jgi:hypothetical protein
MADLNNSELGDINGSIPLTLCVTALGVSTVIGFFASK